MHCPVTLRFLPVIAAAIVLAGAAHGQVEFEAFEPVEAGVTDADPLATSLRDQRFDLRQPVEFERVYRVPGHPDLLMRVHGGLFAVFPRSVYEQSLFGPVPIIPNDTVFYIGPHSLEPLAQTTATDPPASAPPNGLSDRLDMRADRRLATISTDGQRIELKVDEDASEPGDRRRQRTDRISQQSRRQSQRRSQEQPQHGQPRRSLDTAADLPSTPLILGDPDYRSRRMRELMARAVGTSSTPPARD